MHDSRRTSQCQEPEGQAEAALYDDNRDYAQAVVSTVLSEVAVYLEEQTGKEQK